MHWMLLEISNMQTKFNIDYVITRYWFLRYQANTKFKILVYKFPKVWNTLEILGRKNKRPTGLDGHLSLLEGLTFAYQHAHCRINKNQQPTTIKIKGEIVSKCLRILDLIYAENNEKKTWPTSNLSPKRRKNDSPVRWIRLPHTF